MLGKLSEHDQPGWVMGTITEAVQHSMERFRQKQMSLDEVTQLGWGEAANYFHKRDIKYGTAKLRISAFI